MIIGQDPADRQKKENETHLTGTRVTRSCESVLIASSVDSLVWPLYSRSLLK